MTDDRSKLASILAVAVDGVSCVASAINDDVLVYGMWTAVFALAGGMMLFLVITCSGSGLTT